MLSLSILKFIIKNITLSIEIPACNTNTQEEVKARGSSLMSSSLVTQSLNTVWDT